MKWCSRCETNLPNDAFSARFANLPDNERICRECHDQEHGTYRDNNHERLINEVVRVFKSRRWWEGKIDRGNKISH